MYNTSILSQAQKLSLKDRYNARCAGEFWGWTGLMFLALFTFGLIPMIICFADETGKLEYMCGLYNNKYVNAKCDLAHIGYMEVFDRVYKQETNEWISEIVGGEYELGIEIITVEPPEFVGNLSIVFKKETVFRRIVEEYNLIEDTTIPCKIMNKMLREKDSKGVKKPIQTGSLSMSDWDPLRFTFDSEPYCGYVHIIWISILLAYILLPLLAGCAGVWYEYHWTYNHVIKHGISINNEYEEKNNVNMKRSAIQKGVRPVDNKA